MPQLPSPLRSLLRQLRTATKLLLKALAFTYCTVEYGLLLLLNRNRLLQARFVTPLWFWSFGHQAADLQMLSLRFHGKNMVVLLSDYANFNPYIVASFQGHVHICILKHSRVMQALRPLLKNKELQQLKLRLIGMVLRFSGGTAEIVPDFHEQPGTAIGGFFVTERMRLMRERPDIHITALPEPIERFRRQLEACRPDLANRWFVALYLRKKGQMGDELRDTPPATYSMVPMRIRELGGYVLCGGDYANPHTLFPGMEDALLGYADLPCERALIDYFALTQCRFLISGTSGPGAIAIAFNTPTLLTNCPFYYYAGSRENQIVLYKKIRDKTGRILTARETRSFPIVSYRTEEEFRSNGLEHINNTKEEIGDALEEMIEWHIQGKHILTPEDEALYQNYRQLLPPESIAYQSPCRPARGYLRNLHW